MKIEIKEALEEVRNQPDLDGQSIASVRVEMERNGSGEYHLTWQIYATDERTKSTAWSDIKPTFPEALANLKNEFAKRRGEKTFIEE